MVSELLLEDAVAEAFQLDLCFRSAPGQTRHVPFALTPSTISPAGLQQVLDVAPLLGRLTQKIAGDPSLIAELHAPLADGDPFFAELMSIHEELHAGGREPARIPLLLQRSDFMLDQISGPSLVECNSIAAGMAPFGERIQQLHRYLGDRWPLELAPYSVSDRGSILPNPSIANMADAIRQVAEQVRHAAGDGGPASFLMVVQENEDNIFDQRLLERALQSRGVKTFRRTLRQLHAELSSGPDDRLLLHACGGIDVVYLRTGYQYQDYKAVDLDANRCCDALRETRIFIERHRVAVNATVAQQLATSKRTQQYLSACSANDLVGFGFSAWQAKVLKSVFVEMRAITNETAGQIRRDAADWVLKNQGEGGGHCLFDERLIERLDTLPVEDRPAWTLMRRLRPQGRSVPTLVVRNGEATEITGLISEIGIFTAHLGDEFLLASSESPGYVGYLVRSKPHDIAEGGVHSGSGMLDSLVLESS